ncbi:hypothetical protein [Kosakonia arachidis]|uniref:hypothetical protein n=1 Tax=Kosakonia arachidis TaxID=551989 RepID=UPI0011136A0D
MNSVNVHNNVILTGESCRLFLFPTRQSTLFRVEFVASIPAIAGFIGGLLGGVGSLESITLTPTAS